MKFTFRINSKPYMRLDAFFEDLFYKNPKLGKIALRFVNIIYSEASGVMADSWRSNISRLFKCYPLDENEEKMLKNILNTYFNIIKSRGSKNYKILLEKDRNNEIELGDAERTILKRAFEWNSAVSGYYSILKKLKGIGLIKKSKGYFIRSNEFLNVLNNLKELFNSFEDNKDVYATK